jgi:hypothetical protein
VVRFSNNFSSGRLAGVGPLPAHITDQRLVLASIGLLRFDRDMLWKCDELHCLLPEGERYIVSINK